VPVVKAAAAESKTRDVSPSTQSRAGGGGQRVCTVDGLKGTDGDGAILCLLRGPGAFNPTPGILIARDGADGGARAMATTGHGRPASQPATLIQRFPPFIDNVPPFTVAAGTFFFSSRRYRPRRGEPFRVTCWRGHDAADLPLTTTAAAARPDRVHAHGNNPDASSVGAPARQQTAWAFSFTESPGARALRGDHVYIIYLYTHVVTHVHHIIRRC